jgi:hypothetical protein
MSSHAHADKERNRDSLFLQNLVDFRVILNYRLRLLQT